MSRPVWLLCFVLTIWAIADCLARRANPFWILIILVMPVAGPLLYFAWTRNWLGGFASTRWWRQSGPYWDSVAEGSPAALQRKGAALVRRGRHDEAVAVFEKLLEHEGPAVPSDARFDIALAYKSLGRWRDALDQLGLIVGTNPMFRSGEALLEFADCHEQLHDDRQARMAYEQLLKTSSLPEARYRYGILLDRSGEKAAAAEQMRLLLAELDQSPDFYRHQKRHFAKMAKRFLRGNADSRGALRALAMKNDSPQRHRDTENDKCCGEE